MNLVQSNFVRKGTKQNLPHSKEQDKRLVLYCSAEDSPRRVQVAEGSATLQAYTDSLLFIHQQNSTNYKRNQTTNQKWAFS